MKNVIYHIYEVHKPTERELHRLMIGFIFIVHPYLLLKVQQVAFRHGIPIESSC